MKAILEFDTEEYFDRCEFLMASNAKSAWLAMNRFREWLHGKNQYTKDDKAAEIYSEVIEQFNNYLEQEDLNLEWLP